MEVGLSMLSAAEEKRQIRHDLLSKSARKSGMLLSRLLGARINVLEIVGVVNMKLIRRDSHNRTCDL